MSISRDTSSVIEEMVNAYNTAVMFIQEKTKYDAKERKSGILANDYSVTTIWAQIKQPWTQSASGFGGDDSFIRPSDIGITLGADGMLEFDANTFDEAVVDDYLGVLSLLGALKTGSSDSADIKFYGANKYTTAGQFEVQARRRQPDSARIREVGRMERRHVGRQRGHW